MGLRTWTEKEMRKFHEFQYSMKFKTKKNYKHEIILHPIKRANLNKIYWSYSIDQNLSSPYSWISIKLQTSLYLKSTSSSQHFQDIKSQSLFEIQCLKQIRELKSLSILQRIFLFKKSKINIRFHVISETLKTYQQIKKAERKWQIFGLVSLNHTTVNLENSQVISRKVWYMNLAFKNFKAARKLNKSLNPYQTSRKI